MCAIPIRKEARSLSPAEIVPLFLTYKRACGLSSRTIQDYGKTLDLLFKRFPDALDFPRERTMGFLSHYENPSSYNLHFSYLKCFWDWSMSEGLFRGERHPLGGLKKRKPRGRIVQLEEKEVATLLKQPNKGTFAGFRDYALLCLSIDTAIRPGEALQLLRDDLNPTRREIVVRAEVAKTRSARVLPLSPQTLKGIMDLLSYQPSSWKGAPIFCTERGTQLSETAWSRRVAVYGKACGLSITAYSLRHAAALLLLRRGADAFSVQMILGHSTMQMTRHYVNLTSEDARRGHSKAGVMSALLGGGEVVRRL